MSNLDNTDFDDLEFEESPQPGASQSSTGGKKGGNRNFILAIGVLGGIFLLSVIALVVVAMVLLPNRSAAQSEDAAKVLAQNTATAQSATELAYANQLKLTPSPTVAPPTATNTPVIALPTETPAPTQTQAGAEVRTATVSALLTQAAQSKLTATVLPTTTSLPDTGFMDEVGLPGLFGLALVLVLVIVMARRLRFNS